MLVLPKQLIAITLLLILMAADFVFAAQTHYTQFEVASGQVPSAQTNFPAIISWCDVRIRHTSDGGNVADTSGFDIRPYSDAALSTVLTFELVSYTSSGSEGCVEMYILIASIDVGSDVYLGYGDTSLTTDGSSTSTWPSAYQGVYLFRTTADSTANGRTMSIPGGGPAINQTTSPPGVVGAYADFDGAFDACSSEHDWYGGTAAVTHEMWLRHDEDVMSYLNFHFTGGVGSYFRYGDDDGTHIIWQIHGTTAYGKTDSTLPVDGTWYHVVIVFDGGGATNPDKVKIYINGAVDTLTMAGTWPTTLPDPSSDTLTIGTSYVEDFDGGLAALKYRNDVVSADYVLTRYQNENALGFWDISSEVAVGGGGAPFGCQGVLCGIL